MKTIFYIFISVTLLHVCFGDTPANCTINEILGDWVFYEGPRGGDRSIDCSRIPNIVRKTKITLSEGGVAVADNWFTGGWTMIYNQGFEVNVNFRTYFAYSEFEKRGNKILSDCGNTQIGKSHDVTLRDWSCYYGLKSKEVGVKLHKDPFEEHDVTKDDVVEREHFENIVNEVNSHENIKWHAEVHEPFVGITKEDLLNLRGGRNSWLGHRPKPKLQDYTVRNESDSLDYRNYLGRNFVSPVRNQGSCGSCYAFSSVGMLEARLRFYTNNKLQPTFSPQDIVSCTELAQGCSGGFPYLIAGRYAVETGVVDESCDRYTGKDDVCPIEKCARHYVAGYRYIGGYYGASNELNMIEALRNGPYAVSFEVLPDFMTYKGGIYHHTGVGDEKLHPFIVVNHAVLLVGYGYDQQLREKYWIVKNSWGEDWGEKGYFRIRRGTNEVGIESVPIESFPIPY